MPHPDVLKVLGMTKDDWGALPYHNDTRQRLKEKAIAILSGNDIPVNASDKAVVVLQAQVEAERSGMVSQAGFEEALINQAKQFRDAVEELRQKSEMIINQIRVMEDSRADYTFLIEERCDNMRKTIDELKAALEERKQHAG